MKKGGTRKAPGFDGLPQEFYSAVWETAKEEIARVVNCMFRDKTTSQHQKRGVLISIPKTANPLTISDYRQITLLPTDYKLLARVLAQRIKVATSDKLYDTQYCGVAGRTVTDALAFVRDAIAYAEYRNNPMCVVSIDFTQAFDRISHSYLFRNLPHFGITDWFIERLRALYEDADAAIQINGDIIGTVPIECGVRQG
jgi:hypothetical protein